MCRLGILLLIFLLISGCSDHYRVKTEAVEFLDWNLGLEKTITQVQGADPRTFTQLSGWYGKDKKAVYWMGNAIPEADPSSFQIINDYYSVDAKQAYVSGQPIQLSDAKTFEYIKSNWSRDKDHYFYMGNNLEVCDYTSFKIIEEFVPSRAIDKKCYYYQSFKVEVRSFANLEILESLYAKDTERVYWANIAIDEANPETFRVIDSMRVGVDENQCFSGPKVLPCSRMIEDIRNICGCPSD